MSKYQSLSIVVLFLGFVLVACNNGEPSASEDIASEANEEKKETNESTDDETDTSESADDQADKVNDSEANSDDNDAMADGEFNDQLELRIGDTGTVESTTGLYEITLNDVEVIQEVDGQLSELDEFIIADYTIRNIGEEAINALETISNFELTDAPEAAGMTDMAEFFEDVDAFEGDINPDEQATAHAVYYTFDADEYYVLVTEGLVGSGAVKNQITFTFDKSEAE